MAKVSRIMELTWDSLQSHLPDAVSQQGLNDCCLKNGGNQKFHQKCVKEYAEIIYLASQLI